MNWTRILTLLAGLALLASLPVGSEEALTGQSGVKVLPDTSIINPCQTGRVVMGSTTGAKYRCISAIWVKEEVPRCSLLIADPPSGSCSGTDMCLSKTDGTIYVCNESNIWEAYTTGGGGSGSPGGATTQVQFNLLGAFAGDAHLTWNAGSDTLTATNISSTTGSYQNLTASSLFRLPQDTGTGGHNSGDMRWYADIPYIYLGGAWRRIFNTIDEPVVMDDICLDDDEDGSACSVETDSSAKKITVQGSSSDSMQYKGSNFIYTKSGQTATVGFSNPPTGTRVLDFPDASGTIAVNGQAQNRVLLSGASYAISGDADLTFSGASNILSVGNVTDGAQILFGDTYLWRASDGELNIRHDGTNNSGLSIWAPLGDSDEAGINLSTDYDGTYSSYCHGMDIVSEDYDTTGWFGTDYEGLVLQRRCGRSKFNFEVRDWDGTSEEKRLNLDGNAALTIGSINLDATMDGTTESAITSSGDLDGNGTANSADWNFDSTLDEYGSTFNNTVKLNRLILPRGTGASGSTHASNILELVSMMSSVCTDPWTCSRAAVVDTWQDLFQNQPMRFNADAAGGYYEIVQANINKCYGADCTGNENYMCIDSVADLDADGTRDIDPDADGTPELKLGDSFTVGNDYAPKYRSHLIYSQADGDGTTCPATTLRIAVGPYVNETQEGVAANAKIMNIWRNRLHMNFNAGYLMGYKYLGYGSLIRYGQMGPNLLPNGDLDYDATVGRWTISGTAPDNRSWSNDPITTGFASFSCSQGSTTNVCMDMGGTTAADYWESTDWIPVSMGEQLAASCYVRDPGTAPNSTLFGLYSDTNEDGILSAETGMTWNVPSANAYEYTASLQSFWATWTIPEGVSRVKFRITKNTAGSARPLLDDCWLKRPVTSLIDSWDSATRTEYLIPDPGDRTILITGDSWTGGFSDACVFPCNTTLGYYIRDGLADALYERLGRDVSGQIYLSGIGGINSTQFLSGTACREDADSDGTNRDWGYSGGSESCFYMQVERYEPAIVIVSLGTNDAQQSLDVATYVNNMRQIAAKIRAIGAFPIFLAPYPVSKDENSDNLITAADFGAGKTYEFAHRYRDALMAAWKAGRL